MSKLSPSQFQALKKYCSLGHIGVERDGTYMPYVSENRTYVALEKKGLLAWAETGKDGYIYNGYYITEAGKLAFEEKKNEDSY